MEKKGEDSASAIERCSGGEDSIAAATVEDSEEKAAKLARVGMEAVWGLRRVFKREVWNRKGATEEDGGSAEPDVPPVMVVRGKDATRGLYRLPSSTKVCKKSLTKGRKLRSKKTWTALKTYR